MGIDGDVPSQIEADDDIQKNERLEPDGAEVQIEAEEEENKEQGDMEKHTREAIGGETLRAGKWPDKVCTVSL